MKFKALQEVRLDIDYEAPIINGRYDIPLGGVFFAYYPLRTGANWDGPIGELNIRVRPAAETIVQIVPKGFTRTPGLIEWRLKDAEPSQDLFIIFDPYTTEGYLSHMAKKPGGPDQSSGDAWLAGFAEDFLKGLDQRLDALWGLWRLAEYAPNYRRFSLPGAEGSVAVIGSQGKPRNQKPLGLGRSMLNVRLDFCAGPEL